MHYVFHLDATKYVIKIIISVHVIDGMFQLVNFFIATVQFIWLINFITSFPANGPFLIST